MEQAKYDVFISYSRKDYVDERVEIVRGKVHLQGNKNTIKQITIWQQLH